MGTGDMGLKTAVPRHERGGMLSSFFRFTSDRFQKDSAGEDMKKGDEEYIRWAGELQIRTRIETDLKHLKDIEFVARDYVAACHSVPCRFGYQRTKEDYG